MAPSPTADATRFIDSSRTSPAANTPGRLVSRANGARARLHGVSELDDLGPGEQEAVGVAGDRAAEPVGAR